ncbi:MAG: hypothetical protein ACOCXH_00235 [Cyclobacteriaceae bacterium]
MAKPTIKLIDALRKAATKIEKGNNYQWGHMGSCNCGHLAQEITNLSKAEIHQYALRRYGDWTEQSQDYCDNSGMTFDLIISEMLKTGMEIEDIRHLEKLSDQQVLRRFPLVERNLKHNDKRDVVKYMREWANLMEEQLLEKVSIDSLNKAYQEHVVKV